MLCTKSSIIPCLCLAVLCLILAELVISRESRTNHLYARHLVNIPNLARNGLRNGKRAAAGPTPIHHMLETCLYIRNMPTSVKFYRDALGLNMIMNTPKLSGFSIGMTTLLLFHLGETSEDMNFSGFPGNDEIAGHGPDANIVSQLGLQNNTSVNGVSPANHPEVSLKLHFALAVETREQVYQWEDHLNKTGVHIHSTMEWERGGRSLYFFDPDGHVGEIVSRGIWPHW